MLKLLTQTRLVKWLNAYFDLEDAERRERAWSARHLTPPKVDCPPCAKP